MAQETRLLHGTYSPRENNVREYLQSLQWIDVRRNLDSSPTSARVRCWMAIRTNSSRPAMNCGNVELPLQNVAVELSRISADDLQNTPCQRDNYGWFQGGFFLYVTRDKRIQDAKSILLKGGEPVKQYVLKGVTSAPKGFIQTAQKYQAVIRKPPAAAKIGRWLTTWELAMAEALKHWAGDG